MLWFESVFPNLKPPNGPSGRVVDCSPKVNEAPNGFETLFALDVDGCDEGVCPKVKELLWEGAGAEEVVPNRPGDVDFGSCCPKENTGGVVD